MDVVMATIVLGVAAGVLVALVGLAFIGSLVQRSRQRADRRLDEMQQRVLQMAIELSDGTRAQGWEARLRLIRAANIAMGQGASPE